ncbi:MAG: phosphatase PAP2 family protein, partial [Pseudorhodobacter sp.]|nr:phosphatase PAP2 family protein [Pseudorhodobacter sp.]
AFVLALAFNQALLLGIHRPRPYDAGLTHLILPASADWSFPSDHASASFAIVFAFLHQRLPLRTLGLLGLASLICLSRIYCGIHYAGDILGGIATALLAATCIRLAYREGSRLDRFLTGLL